MKKRILLIGFLTFFPFSATAEIKDKEETEYTYTRAASKAHSETDLPLKKTVLTPESTFYISAKGGYIYASAKIDDPWTDNDYFKDDVKSYDLALGHYLSHNVRVEASYIKHSKMRDIQRGHRFGSNTERYDRTIKAEQALLSGYVDFREQKTLIRPYIGVGIGVGWTETKTDGLRIILSTPYTYTQKDRDFFFTWQMQGGLFFRLNRFVGVDVSARIAYLDYDDDNHSRFKDGMVILGSYAGLRISI